MPRKSSFWDFNLSRYNKRSQPYFPHSSIFLDPSLWVAHLCGFKGWSMSCVARKKSGILNSQKDSFSPWKDEIPWKLTFFGATWWPRKLAFLGEGLATSAELGSYQRQFASFIHHLSTSRDKKSNRIGKAHTGNSSLRLIWSIVWSLALFHISCDSWDLKGPSNIFVEPW